MQVSILIICLAKYIFVNAMFEPSQVKDFVPAATFGKLFRHDSPRPVTHTMLELGLRGARADEVVVSLFHGFKIDDARNRCKYEVLSIFLFDWIRT